MRISDLLKMGLKSLSRRKTRTILTVLGVIIGSTSIIIMISLGKGMTSNFDSQVMQYGGMTTIMVSTYGDMYDDDGNWVGSKEQKLDDNLVEQIKAIDHVRAVTPVIYKMATLNAGKYQSWISITAMDSDVFDDFDFPALQYGELPTKEDNTSIVFGYSQPDSFQDPNAWYYAPVEVDMQKQKVVLKFNDYQPDPKKKEFSLPLTNIAKLEQTDGDFDWNIYMDLDYMKELYQRYCNTLTLQDRKNALKSLSEYTQIKLNVDNIKNVEKVQDAITDLGYVSTSNMQWLKPLRKTSETLQMIFGFVGAFAMLVSAISIANTMIMSIYERTKEIGIMKVLGCTVRDIKKLFLFEAAMIGLFGGILGVLISLGASWAINKFGAPIFGSLMNTGISYDMENTKFSVIPIYMPVLSLGLSIGVGLLSGYFPARRATKIKAIEAMKNEN